jgi:hypothetical protein
MHLKQSPDSLHAVCGRRFTYRAGAARSCVIVLISRHSIPIVLQYVHLVDPCKWLFKKSAFDHIRIYSFRVSRKNKFLLAIKPTSKRGRSSSKGLDRGFLITKHYKKVIRHQVLKTELFEHVL